MSDDAIRTSLPVRTGPATLFVRFGAGGCDIRVECAVKRDDDLPRLCDRLIAAAREIATGHLVGTGGQGSRETLARMIAARLRGPFARRMTVSVTAPIANDSGGVTVSTIE